MVTGTLKEGIYEREIHHCGDSAAYIDTVPGENHDQEFDQLLEKRSSFNRDG